MFFFEYSNKYLIIKKMIKLKKIHVFSVFQEINEKTKHIYMYMILYIYLLIYIYKYILKLC